MSSEIKRRRGTTAQHAAFTGAEGEITVDTDKETAVVHDGATAGGFPLAREDRNISAGEGLQGGGTLASNRTLALNVSGLTSVSTVNATNDLVPVWVASLSAHRQVAISQMPTGGAGDGGVGVSAGTNVRATGTVTLADSNGVSFGMNTAGVITASYSQSTHSHSTAPAAVVVGASTLSAGSVVLSNANGISFGFNGSTITASHAAITSQSVQTQGMVSVMGSTGAVGFADSNGVSFGGNASTITAKAAAIQSVSVLGNTAGSTSAGSGSLVIAGGANVTLVGATAVGGMTLSISGGAGTGTGGGGAGNVIAAGASTAASTGTVVFSNSNGVSFGLDGATVTASHNALTTARASTDAIGLNTAATNVTWTVNSSGISLDAGAYLTSTVPAATTVLDVNYLRSVGTAGSWAREDHAHAGVGAMAAGSTIGNTAGATSSHYGTWVVAGSGNITVAATHTGGASAGIRTMLLSVAPAAASAPNGSYTFQTLAFSNSNGISFSTGPDGIVASHNALTTARASNDAVGLNTAGTNVTWTVNSSGISLNAGAYLTTARASTDAIGLNTAATQVTWTVNSSGISLNAGAYLTTAAASTHSHGNPTLALTNISGTTASASNGLTLSLSANPAGGADGYNIIAVAGSTAATTGTIVLSNANGVSFGLNGATVTASHNALTTARASTDAIGLNTAATQVTWTVNSSGISLNAGAYLTTAAASTHSHGNPTLALTNISGTTASASNGLTLSLSANPAGGADGYNIIAAGGSTAATTGTIVLSNANGISFGLNGATVTASHNALTTARASTDAVGLNTAATQVTWTVNSSGISLNAGAYLTTAAASDHTHTKAIYAISNTTGQSSSSTVDARTLSIRGAGIISVGMSAGEVIVSASAAGAADGYNIIAAGGSTAATTGTIVLSNSNGISFGLNGATVTASHNALTTARASTDAIGLNTAATNVTWTVNSSGISLNAGAYLTTARASTDAIGLNTAATQVTWTVNSSGISLDAGAYLTTAANSTHSHGNPTLALTNLSGTTASASNGLTLSLSAAAAGGGAAISAGSQSGNTGTIVFASSNGVSFGMSGSSQITASVSQVTLSNSNNVSFGIAAGVITATATMSQSNQTIGIYASSQTAGTSSSTFDARSFTVLGSGVVTVGMNAGRLVIDAPAAGGDGINQIAAGTQTAGTSGSVKFADSNGVSFGMSLSTQVTASVEGIRSFYIGAATVEPLTPHVIELAGAGGISLATGDGSITISANHVGLNTAATAVTWTVNSSGISLNAGAYLTTARASTDAIGLNTAATSVTWTVNSSGISLNAGAYLTTARASTDAIGLNTAATSVTWTVNSSGISLNAGAYLTTARASTDAIGLNTAATSVTWTVNSSGISLNAGAYLTTQSAQAYSAGSHASATFQTLSLANTNGVTWSTGASGAIIAVERAKTITISAPASTEDVTILCAVPVAGTITRMVAVVRGTTPSVSWTVRKNSDRSATGTEVVTGGTTTTSQTTGSVITSFNSASIAASDFVWLEITSKSGTVDEFSLTVYYT